MEHKTPNSLPTSDSEVNKYYETIISGLVAMRNMLGEDAKRLVANNPHWDQHTDARVTVFWNAQTILASTALGLVFVKRSLHEESFSKVINVVEGESWEVAKRELERGLEAFVKLGLLQFLFSVVESAFRAFLRAFESQAFSKGTLGFMKVYGRLQRHLASISEDSGTLLELWAEIRNAIHNNGVYFNPKGDSDVEVIYKGNSYKFKNGQKVDFADWKRLLLLTLDLRELLLQIVNDENLKVINGTILDLSQ
jgi:hypothetical protein